MKRGRILRRSILPALCVLSAACRQELPGAFPPLRPPAPPAAQRLVDAEGVSHAGTLVPAGGFFDWQLPEALDGRLRLSWSSPESRGKVSLIAEILAEGGAGQARSVFRRSHATPPVPAPAAFWNEDVGFSVRGHSPRLRLRLEPPAPLFLSDLRLVKPSGSADAVVIFLFDTTRRDAVGFGGCVDPSTPSLDAIFRNAWKPGRAYAAASWTIPSVASLLTGRVPAANEDADGSPLGIRPSTPTLAEDFRRAGWSTAAFIANPTLRVENGFAAGFETYFTTPLEGASITLPGTETIKHVPGWLEAHRGEPFLLLIHLLDPHDPYMRFDRPRGETPFDPHYRGPIVGDEVNRLQLGEMPPPPAAGVRHLEALYHDEVSLADALVGKLWNSQPDSERSRWTALFTSDHGEEFGEHGGWKHGPALFDDVLRVPLAIRPGPHRRLPAIPDGALVSLLDVLPTLETLAGLPSPTRILDGANLLDRGSADREVLPPVTMLTGGPPRAAVVGRSRKLFFFDRLGTRGIPDPAKDPDGYRLARRLPGLLPGIGSFDLAADPGETRLLPIDRARFPSDWRSIEQAIAHTRRGIELRLVGAPGGSPLEVTVEGLAPDAAMEAFALEKDDRFSWSRSRSGSTLRARLDLSDGVDGFRFDDAGGAELRITVGAGGCARLQLAGARPLELAARWPQAVPRAAIPEAIPLFAPADGCAGIFLWKAAGRAPVRPTSEQEEALEKLRALGYLH